LAATTSCNQWLVFRNTKANEFLQSSGRLGMTEGEYRSLEPLLEPLAAKLQAFLESAELGPIRESLQKASVALTEGMSVTLSCNLEVFDSRRGRSINLLQTGLTTSDGLPPYICWGDASDQRYVVRGTICQVPQDYCPACWGKWDFKQEHRTCAHCGVQLGNEVKILLDSDVCPHCEKGKVSMDNPQCPACGHTVDLSIVAWG